MSHPSTKKRKQNPLEESDTPSKKQRKQQKAAKDEPPSSDEIPFILNCPVRYVAKKGKKQTVKDDVFGPKQEDGGFANLKISYAIRPGKAWADLRTYRNFSGELNQCPATLAFRAHTDCSISVQDQKFSTGSLVYINKRTPPPELPGPDASEAEILAFDKENLWVGQVLEVKAASPSQVWLRVFWLYWPEELPRGRQKYHGNQELIMSNHMEIVDAMTVTSSADIVHWDEKAEDQDVGQRFWRQFYDIQLEPTKNGGLSTIRSHCVCNEFYNPDEAILICPNSKCGIWNHQECVEQAVLAQIYARLVGNQNSLQAEAKPSLAPEMAKQEEDLKFRARDEQRPRGTSAKLSSWKNSTMQPAPWEGLLKAEITVGEKVEGGAFVTITDERAQDPEVWTEGIKCLKCGTLIK